MYHVKNDNRAKQSGKLIFQALKVLAHEKDYNSITITQIAQAAKIGRATFYRNFDCPDDVLIYEIDKKHKLLNTFLANFSGEDKTPYKSLFKLILTFWDMHSDLIELLEKCGKSYLLFTPMCNVFSEFKHFFCIPQNTHPLDLQFIIEVRSHIILIIIIRWISLGKPISCQQLIKLSMDQLKRAAELNIVL